MLHSMIEANIAYIGALQVDDYRTYGTLSDVCNGSVTVEKMVFANMAVCGSHVIRITYSPKVGPPWLIAKRTSDFIG